MSHPVIQRWRARLGDFRLGIAARLGVAFAAVTVLATAANLIAEHGNQLIHTTHVVAIVRPAAASGVRHAPALIPITSQPAQPAAPKDVSDTVLIDAIDQFVRVVEQRTQADDAATANLLGLAQTQLRDALNTFLLDTRSTVVAARAHVLKSRVAVLRSTADTTIRDADERRTVLGEYWRHFDTVDAQIKTVLDQNNWKLFGRVIARESLVNASRDLEDIRRQSELLDTRGSDSAALARLVSSQQHFTALLADNSRAGLARSQSAQWLADLREEFAACVASREKLVQLDSAKPDELARLEGSSEQLTQLVRSMTAAVADDTGRTAAQTPAREARQLVVPDEIVPPAFQPAPEVAAAPTRPANDGTVIAVISGGVMLILLTISVATVRSIVLPIRQFMRITERIAHGDDTARFARGGIKELDALAVALNRMAESLADARVITREYQGQLESRVDERTRQLQHLAEHDPLTGLPNRRQLVAYLDASLQRAAHAGKRVAVFFLDLDNFKNINDSMGHAFGDLVLQRVAQRLREAAGENGFAARLGGDEFTVVQENIGSRAAAAEVGNALVRAFQTPLSVENRELIISISGGASVYPDHERDSDALLRAADAALFRAKTSGRARLSLFSPDLLEEASLKFSLEQGLRRALERGELELWFQPEISLTTLDTKLVEALLRWRLPDGQYITPADFLGVAEDSGLIRSINDWVLRTAFQHVTDWHRGEWPDARVAINVSARQLLDSGFVSRVRELLEEHRLPPRCIEIELTETVLQTEAATVEVLRELRQLDINVALDDFGSGYSSVTSLERLPLTRVKLDRSLIDSIDTSARSLAIARATIGLCENLGLEVTAEGVERPEQLALLLANPTLTLQGYLLAHPIKPQDMPGAGIGMRPRMESLLLTVPVVNDVPTVAAHDARELLELARASF